MEPATTTPASTTPTVASNPSESAPLSSSSSSSSHSHGHGHHHHSSSSRRKLRHLAKATGDSFLLGISFFCMSILAVRSYQTYRKLQKYRKEVAKQVKLRQDERNGRISLEKKLRQEHQESLITNGINFKPIGVIESPFVDRRGTPRQPILVPAAKGYIRFNKKLIQYQHFEELSQFSHIWVIFLFHENTNQHQLEAPSSSKNSNNSTKASSSSSSPGNLAKIAPPRLLGTKVGCLTTRSPHRPNPIGLSVCEILSVGQDYIEICCLDLIHGTPVLDVKPYIPYDLVPSNYQLPMVTSSDGQPLKLRPLQVPNWIVESDIPLLPVSFTPEAYEVIQELMVNKVLKFCTAFEDATELISQVLRQDIRGVHQGRGKTSDENAVYLCRLDAMDISFISQENRIIVQRVEERKKSKSISSPSPSEGKEKTNASDSIEASTTESRSLKETGGRSSKSRKTSKKESETTAEFPAEEDTAVREEEINLGEGSFVEEEQGEK